MDTLCLKTGIGGIAPGIPEARANLSHVSAVGRDKTSVATAAAPPQKTASRFSFMYPLQSLWPGGGEGGGGGGGRGSRYNGIAVDDAVLVDNKNDNDAGCGEGRTMGTSQRQNGNWVLKILHIKSLRKEQGEEEGISVSDEASNEEHEKDAKNDGSQQQEEEEEEVEEEECDACKVEEDEEKGIEFDRESFSRLLRRVSLAEAKLYAQMSYLGRLAYCILKIKPGNLLKYRGLRFVTSSIERRELAAKADKIQISTENKEPEERITKEEAEGKEQKNSSNPISASTAYQIAASAASYLHAHTKSILPFKSSKAKFVKDSTEGFSGSNENNSVMDFEVASLMATTDSVTAVVAAKEEVKQAVADDLSSTRSSPCEWFICDDDKGTRFFVIQGSESMASWQANLFFEPVQFEGLDVLVHRGIYEAAKGMYEQMLPEVRAHLKSCGAHATFRFTGHSLGGSLSLLVNLMLLIRGEVQASSLLPVITFGAPSIMCGGDYLLHKLGLPRSHVQAITMHRDIVPRAFSCHYPKHIAELLKAVNGNFRSHPCLTNQKLLYAPMGDLLILQPDEKFSPHHHLLPSGSGLYFLSSPSDSNDAEKLLQAAQTVFLNSPHPLEVLSDRSAYGSEGTIQRDHDMNSYLKSVQNVIRQELNQIRRSRREHRQKFWWSILAPSGSNGSVIMGKQATPIDIGQNQFNFSGALQTGRRSLKRFSRLIASQHMHLFVVLLLPARLLLLGAYSAIGFR